MKVLTIASDPNHTGLKRFTDSLTKYGWEFEILVKPFQFGGQMQHIAEWCKGKTEPFIYCDAYDTICFGLPFDFILNEYGEMLISTEKACYPHADLAVQYPETPGPWKYVNGGGFMTTTQFFTELFKLHKEDDNDQDWLARMYLANQDKIKLDRECAVFQTIAFSNPEEWEKDGERWRNVGTGTHPVFFHGNGHTLMDWLTL